MSKIVFNKSLPNLIPLLGSNVVRAKKTNRLLFIGSAWQKTVAAAVERRRASQACAHGTGWRAAVKELGGETHEFQSVACVATAHIEYMPFVVVAATAIATTLSSMLSNRCGDNAMP